MVDLDGQISFPNFSVCVLAIAYCTSSEAKKKAAVGCFLVGTGACAAYLAKGQRFPIKVGNGWCGDRFSSTSGV